MRLLKVLLLLMLPTYLHAQITYGRVVDADEDTPIVGASIYLSGTYQGTTSDAKGHFELHTNEKNIPLMISCVGYLPVTINDYSGKNLKILLKRKSNVLKEVTIGYNAMSREKEMKIFMREFIGDNHKCIIKNPDDITFSYHKKEDMLEAFAEQPLIIENKDLGYTLTYFLDNFSYRENLAGYHGECFFKEDTAGLSSREIKKILKNRSNAYFGSRMHFIRSLWANELDNQEFTIKDNNNNDIKYNDLILTFNDKKYIRSINELFILHDYEASLVQQSEGSQPSFIAANGFYEGSLIWRGIIGLQRVGDLLPFEFQPMKH